MTRVPQKFFGLHNHTNASPFDGLGEPDEHFKFCMSNGLDGHAITEHGNMNSYPTAQLWMEGFLKENKDKKFKYIPGIEMYFHPDLEQWKQDKLQAEQNSENAKAAKKAADKSKKDKKTDISVVESPNEDVVDIETSNALTIENESESKSKKYDPVKRRHHLVVLPKNQRGLLKLFKAVSFSTMQGFYRFPRIDAKVLRETCDSGDIIISTACLAGLPSFNIFRQLEQYAFDDLNQSLLDDPLVLDKCVNAVANSYELLSSCAGPQNSYLELQFNKLPAQNLVNRAIIEFAKRSNLTKQLIVTCDAHYYNPDIWLERELYKKLGFMKHNNDTFDSLPKSKDDLKCELYPKNATQVWEEYNKIKQNTSFYDDEIICDAIERTHDIAHNLIENIEPDRTPKFANRLLVPEGDTSFKHLVKLCMEGLKKRGLDGKQEYVDRLKEELGVIKQMKNADYFVSYQKIMELARKVTLSGPARGCFTPETKIILSDRSRKNINEIVIGDVVIDAYQNEQVVQHVFEYDVNEEILELEFSDGYDFVDNRIIRCTKDHKFLTENDGWVEAQYLRHDDDVVCMTIGIIKLVNKTKLHYTGKVYDLNVSNSHTYNVDGIAVHNSGGGSLVVYVLYITDIDPIEYQLPFSRFLNLQRLESPDIDCVNENHLIVMGDHSYKKAIDIQHGDSVIGSDGLPHNVSMTYSRELRDKELPLTIFVRDLEDTIGAIDVVPMHKFVLQNGDIVRAKDLVVSDLLKSSQGDVEIIQIFRISSEEKTTTKYVDITVDDNHMFHVIPFDVVEYDGELINTYNYV
jgi:hypothetical protein